MKGSLSSNGNSLRKRSEQFLKSSKVRFLHEMISYGSSEGQEIVLNLVSDYVKNETVPNANVKYLLSPHLDQIGVYSGEHSKYGTMSCIILGYSNCLELRFDTRFEPRLWIQE